MRHRILTFLLLLGSAAIAAAHPNLQDAMWVLFDSKVVRVAVNVSAKELAVAHGLPLGLDAAAKTNELVAAAEAHREYILSHLTLQAGEQALTGKVTKVTAPDSFADPEATFFQYEVEYPLETEPPAEVRFSHRMLAEWPYAIGTPWDVTYAMRTMRSESDEVHCWLLRSNAPTAVTTGWPRRAEQSPPMESAAASDDRARTFGEYLRHGIMHILTGYDHLLFVSALVIAALSFWEMVKVIAAFTLAHSMTLALSVFNIFRLPSYVVEPVIALSIVFVALDNVAFPRHAHSRIRLLVAFGFGMVHGLGFAGGLLDAMSGLPSMGVWIALIAFSLGVEIGHQIVVIPLFGALGWARGSLKSTAHAQALRYGSIVISGCGAYYLAVAINEQFFTR